MSLNLDQRKNREQSMISFNPAHASAHFDIPAVQEAHQRAQGGHAARQRLAVLFGCFSFIAMVALWFATASFHSAPVGCSPVSVRPVFGAGTTATMTVRPGNPCIVFLQPAGSPIEELAVTAAPRHGVVATRGRTGVTYRSEARYRGEDTFELKLRSRSEESAAAIRVYVTIR